MLKSYVIARCHCAQIWIAIGAHHLYLMVGFSFSSTQVEPSEFLKSNTAPPFFDVLNNVDRFVLWKILVTNHR
jgi:hypothetical protein